MALTVWPSSMESTSPRTTAPIDSSSRLRARPSGAGLELEQLVDRGVGQARHAGDAVAHLDDAADLGQLDVGGEPFEVLRMAAVMSAVLMVSSAIS